MEPCWCCGSPTAPSARLAPLPFLSCPRCGFAQRDDGGPEAVVDEVPESHGADGGDDPVTGDGLRVRRRDARVRLDWIGPHLPAGGAVLDVGAGRGAFVEQAVARDLRAWGIEAAPAFARYATEALAVDVRAGLVEDHELPEASLDAITMWHVLEHLPRPAEVLRALRAALRPGGLLCVEVPNADSVVARVLGPDWPGLRPEVHVGQFTPEALGRLLARAGFAVREVVTAPSDVYCTRLERLGPRRLLYRAQFGRRSRPGSRRPAGAHDLLRAVAVRPPVVQVARRRVKGAGTRADARAIVSYLADSHAATVWAAYRTRKGRAARARTAADGPARRPRGSKPAGATTGGLPERAAGASPGDRDPELPDRDGR